MARLLWDTLVGNSCGTLLWDTLVGHSFGTLLWDTLVGHSCRTLLWDTLVGHSCGTLLWDTLVGHSSYETSSKSHTSSLQNERFVRDVLQKSHVKSPTRAFRTRLPPKPHVKSPKRAFRTRLPQKLTRQSLQNVRFVRDFLQKSSANTHRSTRVTQSCPAVWRFQPLQTTPAHTPIPM